MTPDELRDLVTYHYWARDRLLEAVDLLPPEAFTRHLGGSFSSIRDTLGHLQGAEWIWVARLAGESPAGGLPTDRFGTLQDVRAAWAATEAALRGLVEALDQAGVDRTHAYRLLNGQPGAHTVGQVVQHLVNHGTYHRGQVVTMLRQLGARPPASMDLIAFYRERA